nr:MAG TPA: hypothetical protein [Caudoviricetes sp.]
MLTVIFERLSYILTSQFYFLICVPPPPSPPFFISFKRPKFYFL